MSFASIRPLRLAGVRWMPLLILPMLLADVPGFAEISVPVQSEAVSGIVSISGTATHPAFASYELAYSRDAGAASTWFPIVDSMNTPVLDGRLGIWDTTELSDGTYRIRLLVRLKEAAPLEAIVGQIRVRNYTPTEIPPTALPTASPAAPRAAVPDSDPPSAQQPSRDLFASALVVGVLGALTLLFALFVYVRLAPRVRAYAARVRTRRLHRGRMQSRPGSTNRD
jgi:hypothetical protein